MNSTRTSRVWKTIILDGWTNQVTVWFLLSAPRRCLAIIHPRQPVVANSCDSEMWISVSSTASKSKQSGDRTLSCSNISIWQEQKHNKTNRQTAGTAKLGWKADLTLSSNREYRKTCGHILYPTHCRSKTILATRFRESSGFGESQCDCAQPATEATNKDREKSGNALFTPNKKKLHTNPKYFEIKIIAIPFLNQLVPIIHTHKYAREN